MRKAVQRLKNERGLTLVELLAVIVILAIVAAIAFVMIGNIMENSKKDAAISDALQVINSAKLYEATETNATFPIEISKLQDDGHLDTLYDPWTKAEYGKATTSLVSKDGDGKYFVTLNASKCGLSNISEGDLIEKGRENCSTP